MTDLLFADLLIIEKSTDKFRFNKCFFNYEG